MPIQLKNKFKVGDLDKNAGDGYPHCQLSSLTHNGITFSISIEYQFGEASGQYFETWTRGAASPTLSFELPGAQVVPLWSQMPHEGESVGQAIRRVTYEYMISSGLVDGEILDNPPLPPAETPAPEDGTQAPAEPVGDDTAPTPAPDAETPAEDAPEPAAEPATEDAPSEDAEATDKPEAANPS